MEISKSKIKGHCRACLNKKTQLWDGKDEAIHIVGACAGCLDAHMSGKRVLTPVPKAAPRLATPKKLDFPVNEVYDLDSDAGVQGFHDVEALKVRFGLLDHDHQKPEAYVGGEPQYHDL